MDDRSELADRIRCGEGSQRLVELRRVRAEERLGKLTEEQLENARKHVVINVLEVQTSSVDLVFEQMDLLGSATDAIQPVGLQRLSIQRIAGSNHKCRDLRVFTGCDGLEISTEDLGFTQ